MATKITIDMSELQKGFGKLEVSVKKHNQKGLGMVSDEILRLSQFEVPHDTGALQNSGHVEPSGLADEYVVGYNKVYAARLHENPQYNFQKGRKGKYLEDPIKLNLSTFLRFYGDALKGVFA